jgi:Oxysterol-binding protein
VDAAAREKEPLKRIAFVAAFAMSNYSSTIGRIAKPFNPMLVRFAFLKGLGWDLILGLI